MGRTLMAALMALLVVVWTRHAAAETCAAGESKWLCHMNCVPLASDSPEAAQVTVCAATPEEALPRGAWKLGAQWECFPNDVGHPETPTTIDTLRCEECPAGADWCNATGGLLPEDADMPWENPSGGLLDVLDAINQTCDATFDAIDWVAETACFWEPERPETVVCGNDASLDPAVNAPPEACDRCVWACGVGGIGKYPPWGIYNFEFFLTSHCADGELGQDSLEWQAYVTVHGQFPDVLIAQQTTWCNNLGRIGSGPGEPEPDDGDDEPDYCDYYCDGFTDNLNPFVVGQLAAMGYMPPWGHPSKMRFPAYSSSSSLDNMPWTWVVAPCQKQTGINDVGGWAYNDAATMVAKGLALAQWNAWKALQPAPVNGLSIPSVTCTQREPWNPYDPTPP